MYQKKYLLFLRNEFKKRIIFRIIPVNRKYSWAKTGRGTASFKRGGDSGWKNKNFGGVK